MWPPQQYILIQGLLNTQSPTGGNDTNGIPDFTMDAAAHSDYDWTQKLALNLTQTYMDHVYCTWRATGGVLEAMNQTKAVSDKDHDGVPNQDFDGKIYEKYSETSLEFFGGGGEYDIEKGFGWTNGVFIWAADEFKGLELGDHRCDLTSHHLDLMSARASVNEQKRGKLRSIQA